MIAFAPFMSSQDDLSRAYIDAFEFARESRRIEGMIPVASLERLADRLIEPTGALRCRIDGERDRQGSYLRVDVVGMLALRCERCLGTMEFPLHVRNRLRLMKPGAEWPEDDLEDDGADAVEAAKEMFLLPVVEDEVLLALPFAPRHEACDGLAAMKKDQASSPFSVLAKLKK